MRKVFVKVQIEVNTEGEMRPMLLFWEDGRKFEIDRVTEVRRAASMGTGGRALFLFPFHWGFGGLQVPPRN